MGDERSAWTVEYWCEVLRRKGQFMTDKEKELLQRIVQNERIICFHALGQPLVDVLCEIIRKQEKEITQLQDKLARGGS